MESESLDQLKSAFSQWRKTKSGRSEAIPPELLDRARSAAARFGVNAVRKSLNIDRRLIEKSIAKKGRRRPPKKGEIPSYSRVNVPGPSSIQGHPIAEFEMASGSKLRIFAATPETLGLLASLCGLGAHK